MADVISKGRKAKPSAGRSDREVSLQKHDELVNWLIAHLLEVVTYQFGYSEQARQERFDAAIKTWRSKFQAYLVEIGRDLDERALGTPVALSLAAMIERAKVAFAEGGTPLPPAELGSVSIADWSAQKEIHGESSRHSATPKVVGFVDIHAKVCRHDYAEVSDSQWPTVGDREKPTFRTRGYFPRPPKPESDLVAEIDAAQFTTCNWSIRHTYQNVFYDVRSDLPTLAEMLQSLKTLRLHLLGVDGPKVCLFSHDVPALWRTVLPNEGFLVLSRGEITGVTSSVSA